MDCVLLRGNGIGPAAVGLSGSLSWKMEDQAAREDACREYQSSLEDLTFNSKPHINMLTILAEENIQFAKDIVAIIEAQISKAPAAEKLPVLYLVDSIVKNVGGEYLAVFAKNLIASFICVFEKVDENTRKSLFKLRSTWDEVFPLKRLYALDVRVNSLDPAWPIKPLPHNFNSSSSIHVNPRFLKQPEETAPPKPVPAKPAAPGPQVAPQVAPAGLTQEQLIRQQLLAKQKQLLELQQKKIELELEQTKAQLAGQGGLVLPPSSGGSAPAESGGAPRPGAQIPPSVRPWIPPPPPADPKQSTRDPRLNRGGPLAGPQLKESPVAKRESPHPPGGPRAPERPPRPDRARTPRKDAAEEKLKSKSPSPLAKGLLGKSKQAETPKASEAPKKDPRLKKRPQEKPAEVKEVKEEELKEKKRCVDKKEREEASRRAEPPRSNKTKLLNGLMVKHDPQEPDAKAVGRRKRTRSRSRSPATSPKRKDRRSPKGHARSGSLSPTHKPGKPRRVRGDEAKPGREDRLGPKKIQADLRRPKRPQEDRRSESRDSHSPRSHDGGKEAKEALHHWRSGWEENKHMKLPEDSHTKAGPPRHKGHGTPTRPGTPRNQKIRLSVDANLQIPEVLNSASKKDLLRRASKRLESGEISQEDFLNMAHQIKHFFQYQEEKQQLRSENWEEPGDFSMPRPHGAMDAAELSYYEHKSKLRKTQVNRRLAEEEGLGASEDAGEAKPGGGRSGGRPYGRAGERRSKERDDPRPPLAPMVEDYNHGKEFPKLKGLRFRRRAGPGESSEREWTSPLTERQRYDEEHKSGYDAPRRYGPTETRRPEGPPAAGGHRNSPGPAGLEAPPPRFERERLSPLHQKDSADASPIPRFESPNSEHSDEGPLEAPPPHPPKANLKGPPHGAAPSVVRQHGDSPGHTPPHEAGHPPSRYSGPGHMGPSRPQCPGWYEGGGPGRFEEPQFESPHHPGPGRFEGGGPAHHNMPERTEGPGPRVAMRGGGDAVGVFEGPLQGPSRFGGSLGQQKQPVRFEGQMGGPGPMEGPMQRFEGPGPFNNMGPGPMGFQQQRPLRFEGPTNQMGPMRFDGPSRFEGPAPGPRFDLPGGPHQAGPHQAGPHQPGPPCFDYGPGQQGPPRFPPQHNIQLPMQPMAPPIYDGPVAPQQNFGLAPQRFPEPINPQFPTGPNLLPAGTFSMQPAPFSQAGPGPFYNPAAPALNMQQPVNMIQNQNFLPQNPVPFGQQSQAPPPENHFGQLDVNDLLSKLISNGIIRPPSQPEATPTEPVAAAVAAAPAPPVEEEEEEEPEEEEELPDLTGFSIDSMKLRYEGVVTKLYSGNQCCLCSMRFTAAQTDMYADHLDWHFRQNHAGKVASKKVTHRRWYYTLTDWIEFEEIADLEERAKSQFFEKENEEEVQKNQAAAKEKEFQIVRATKDQVGESCEICQEPFETYWVEEEEDWFLKDAVRVDDKNFHPACFEDYKNTSSYLDATPSPSRLMTDHPLGAVVKTEEEEVELNQPAEGLPQQDEPDPVVPEVSADSAPPEDKA